MPPGTCQTSDVPNSGNESQFACVNVPDHVLIFNFFAGILDRGIPIYVQNLRLALEEKGIACQEIRCPKLFTQLPRPLLNLLFVACEQLLTPVAGLRFRAVIHPYNSCSLLGSLLGRSVTVVHDFIPNSKRKKAFSARYIRFSQLVHSLLGAPVVYVSKSTHRIGRMTKSFPRSRTFIFPNSFFEFSRNIPSSSADRGEHVLLCTGWGQNKDLPGALELYYRSNLYKERTLKIFGIAGHDRAVQDFLEKHPELQSCIEVLPRLTDGEVPDAYLHAAWVWVHSRKEGYGRSIAEAKLCGCRVVASDIPPFREQRDEFTFLYSGLDDFCAAWLRCEKSSGPGRREPREHEILFSEIERFIAENHLRLQPASYSALKNGESK